MNIMLACCAGMSTSLVVTKMQEAAKAQGKDYKIWAVEQGQISDELGNFDVLLLGPQVRHILRKVTKIVEGHAPIGVIDPVSVTRKTKRNAAKVNATLRFILQILFKTVAVTFARRRF